MKIHKYKITLLNFEEFYTYLHKNVNGILGATYENETLEIFYEDSANELTETQLKNMKLPTILKFRKKLPTTDISNAKFISENEIVVETFDAEDTRKKVKEKYPDFKEVTENAR